MHAVKNRFSAFAIHLAISAMIAIIAIILVFVVWYPSPVDKAIGVGDIFLLLLGVDLMMGPIITLIIYKPGKPSLKFDLTVIAILQLAALSYGMHTIFLGRPAFVVFCVDRFEITRASDLEPQSLDKAMQDNNPSAIPSWTGPRWVAAQASANPKRNSQIMFSAAAGGPDWQELPELFVPLTQLKAQVLKKAKPLQELRELHKNHPEALAALSAWQGDEVKWLPLKGKVKSQVVLVNAGTAEVIKIVDVNPWPD
jgi:hypothetical protein